MELKQLTNNLRVHLDILQAHYESHEAPTNLKDKEFFFDVKRKTTPYYEMTEKWESEVLDFVKETKPNLHPNQVVSTAENIGLLLMHSYYIDIKRKRYMELIYAVHYIFDILDSELEKVDESL